MAQTKTGSLAEAVANIAVGFGINFTANLIVLPWFGFSVSAGQAFGIGVVFTVISLARSYILRRYFNGLRFGNRSDTAERAMADRYMAALPILIDAAKTHPDSEQILAAWDKARDR